MTNLVHKELGGMEDLLFGEGKAQQVRNGQPIEVTRIKLLYLIRSDAELTGLDGSRFPFVLKVAQDGAEFFRYNGSAYVPVQTGVTPYAPTLGLHFVGIYNDLAELQDGIKRPTGNLQAIVLTPSEKYFHSVGGAWVELAPVGAFHPTYLGVYDTVQDLEVAEPTAPVNSLAIISKAFWYKEASGWTKLQTEDLQTLAKRLDSLSTAVESNLTQKIAGIHVEDEHNNAFDDITDLHIKGGRLEDQQGQSVTLNVEPSVGVSTGQVLGSAFYKAPTLEFPGAVVSPRDNGNILTIYPDKRHSVNGLKVDSWAFDSSVFDVTQDPSGSLKVGVKSSTIAVSAGSDVYTGIATLDFVNCEVKDLGAGVLSITPSVAWYNADSTTPLTGWYVGLPSITAEQHLMLSPLSATLVQDNQGYKALRYTINDTPNQPMPCGVQVSGKLKTDLDASVNTIAGSTARGGEGAIILGSDGITTVASTVRMYNEQGVPASAQFLWNNVQPNGTLVPIEDSRTDVLPLPGSLCWAERARYARLE
ncbi:hypothetical protein ZHX_gp37 [Edwardsiella phage vB_EpP_ZHX]|nr:hypothetical protein ZHX_gp37 [Edwardsiella phage vB_EpP_ZHX]